MKFRLFTLMVLLSLVLSSSTVLAAPNTGPLPENGIKINFNENGSIHSFEASDEWDLVEGTESITIYTDGVTIELYNFVFKDDEELIGFSWTIEGASAEFWVKHGQTSAQYDGEFITSDNKGISNVVWLVTIDDDDEEDDEEDEDDEEIDEDDEDEDEEEEDEEDDNDDEEEEEDEEDDNDDEEEEEDEEDDNDEEEEEEEEERLPDTSDVGTGLGIGLIVVGLAILWSTRKEK